ncbi:hypothetical protein XENTR_v10011865 [Xenopus tropicalis]|uniref:Insulin like 5 n=1 Tax=Xenopus tropicalis TaxID=8364 RepID=A0A6I8SQK1_XENTR|nr:insulin-like peptide INSL5 [Xenopus tropicalis]KAE8609637.1 hypothetical protein XENTR_v10011865 [Xenopus tropicalis]KAE8609638.1 hypothetical protein XENTR_v10011865 [Xenopus tropicalis]
MKVSPLCLVLLTVLIVAAEVRSDNQFVKLCGREFIRAVIYTCGGSRWRRLLPELPQDTADMDSYLSWHNGEMELTPLEYRLQKASSQEDEVFQKTESLGELWDTERKSVQERRDLNELLTTACCKNGCKKKDLSSLC